MSTAGPENDTPPILDDPSPEARRALRGLGHSVTPAETRAAMRRAGITEEDARGLRDRFLAEYPALAQTLGEDDDG